MKSHETRGAGPDAGITEAVGERAPDYVDTGVSACNAISGKALQIGQDADEYVRARPWAKALQRAVVILLEPIYKQDFVPGSHGFRPGRGGRGALEDLWKLTMNTHGGWVLAVGIRKFFDPLDHKHLRDLVQLRVRDGVLLRLIGKWLNAGVMESGHVSHRDSGSPQGGVVSPMLANIYLHYVLDQWFDSEVLPRMAGKAYLIRYADDFVIGFTDRLDAKRMMEVFPKRFGTYGLKLRPTKTRAGAVPQAQ